MKIFISYTILLIISVLCVQTRAAILTIEPDSAQKTDTFEAEKTSIHVSIIDYADNFLGVKYRRGGKTPIGFDCSGYVRFVFNKFGYTTPASSAAIKTVGTEVKKDSAKIGDIIYFTGRNAKTKRPGHVGIITEVKEGVIYFIHASVNYGISYSHTATNYYSRRFLGIRRVLGE